MKQRVCRFLLLTPCLLLALLLGQVPPVSGAEVVRVELRPNVVRSIGGVTRFDRDQFVTFHGSPDSLEMTPEQHRQLRRKLDVRYGRDGGSLSYFAKNTPSAAGDRDLPDVEKIDQIDTPTPRSGEKPNRRSDNDFNQTVICTHPELMHARPGNTHAPWGPRTYEGVAEYTAQLLRLRYTDATRPRYLEVFNEPFVKAKKIGTTFEELSKQHVVVARRVRELCPDVLVGGYSAAWVELEGWDFGHWESRQKRFMDIAGEEMDFFSYHIYDGVNVEGSLAVRTGSNSEAIMDLIDTYSHIRFGVAKPILITEFGGAPDAGMHARAYSAERSAKMLYSFTGQLMTYMDHPDRLAKVIPFILGTGAWTYTPDTKPGHANPFLLWRRDVDGSYVETDLFLYYRFLRGLGGEWRVSRSSNPDVRTHLFVDKKRLTLMMMNLDTEPQRVRLSGLEGIEPRSVTGRFLFTDGERPTLGERDLPGLPPKITLRPGAAVMVRAELDQPPPVRGTVHEQRVYSPQHLRPIKKNKPARFRFPEATDGVGRAVIRISTGRPQGLSKLPKRVKFNGRTLEIPTNWIGGQQEGRADFFGMIEFEAPAELVRPNSLVEVVYPDDGGKIASVVLQLSRLSRGG